MATDKESLTARFRAMRFNDNKHLGLGDVRLTLWEQEQIEKEFAELEARLAVAEAEAEVVRLRDDSRLSRTKRSQGMMGDIEKQKMTDAFEKKKIVRLVTLPDLKCTRCKLPLGDVPAGFYCSTCGWEAK